MMYKIFYVIIFKLFLKKDHNRPSGKIKSSPEDDVVEDEMEQEAEL
jgi:hypothetical protein